MAVTVDGTPVIGVGVVSASSITTSFTAGANTTGLVVGAGCVSGTAQVLSAVTFNAQALSVLLTQDDTAALQDSGIALRVNASDMKSVTANVVTTWTGIVDVGNHGIVGVAGIETSGVANAHRTVAGANDAGGGAPSVTATSVSGDLVIDCAITLNATITVDASQTSQAEDDAIQGGSSSMGISTEVASGVSTVMSWTGGTQWATVAMALIASGGGGGPTDAYMTPGSGWPAGRAVIRRRAA